MEPILQVQNATKRFRDKVVFEHISLQFEAGQSYGFIGYNGCGKSVFFKTLAGFSLLSEGSVIYRGKTIGRDADFIWDAGVLIETPEFLNDLSGFKNLQILAEIQDRVGEPEILETLRLVGLYEERDKKVGKYSLGMKQKLRIAQAMMEKPSLLILDEPLNGLDKSSAATIRALLQKHVEDGGTLLMTSHHREDIDALCTHIYEFEDQTVHPIS